MSSRCPVATAVAAAVAVSVGVAAVSLPSGASARLRAPTEPAAPEPEAEVAAQVEPAAEQPGADQPAADPPAADPPDADQPEADPTTEVAASTEGTPAVDDAADAAPAPAEPAGPQFGFAEEPAAPTSDPAPEPDFAAAPGGYWGPTDTKELPPPDGRRKILIGSILAPLGLLSTTTGAIFTYVSVPEHCVERYANIGIETTRSRCGGLLTLNAIRTTYGGLMLITGTVFLAIGLSQRRKRREWETHHSVARLGRRLQFGPSPGGFALRF